MNRSKLYHRLIFSLLGALIVTAILFTGALDRVDRWAQDGLFQREDVTNTDIVIIGIDQDTIDTLGPFPTNYRDYVAYALEEMAADPEKKPAVVAIDVLYVGNTAQNADAHLASAAAKLGNVVTASNATFGQNITWENNRATSLNTATVVNYELPFDELRECTVQGHINAMYDTDGVMRHALLYIDIDENTRVYSMACETARRYLESKGKQLILPEGEAARQLYVPFTSKPGGYYDGVSLVNVIYGRVPPEYWAGKIVLIGAYTLGLQDAYFTPIDPAQQMYGVEFQANVIQALLENEYKSDIPDMYQYIAVFALCFLAMALFLRLSLPVGGAICAGFILLGFGGAILLYELGYVAHPLWFAAGVLLLYFAALVLKYIRAAKERRLLALEKERIGAELTLATRIQANSLIKDFPPFPDRHEFEIFASMTPAKEVGGDLYDFFMPDDDHLALIIGDVSGKGVPAALFMMVSMTLLRHVGMNNLSPAQVLRTVNEEICARNPEEMFVTVWLGVLEISTGKLVCANAGHEYPAIKAPEGHFELVKDKHGFVLGGMAGVKYREYELQLEPGSKLFVYTDGVPEATDKTEAMFGGERMLEALRASEDGDPEQILGAVSKAVNGFVGGAPQFDDLTMLCLQYNGTTKKSREDDTRSNEPE